MVALTERDWQRLKDFCQSRGLSASAVLRLSLRWALDELAERLKEVRSNGEHLRSAEREAGGLG